GSRRRHQLTPVRRSPRLVVVFFSFAFVVRGTVHRRFYFLRLDLFSVTTLNAYKPLMEAHDPHCPGLPFNSGISNNNPPTPLIQPQLKTFAQALTK
ncbi:hypothetical protein A2U01_0015534, partial [Trifolium medium]|nr:hypothetical protein [Trifolium medium]